MANLVHSQHQKANSPKEPQEATPLGCVRAVGWGLFGNSKNSYQIIEANQKHVQYKSEQYFVSMPKKHIFLQKGSSTLDDISLQNVIAHPAEFFFVFF